MIRISGYLTSAVLLLALVACDSPTSESGLAYEASARVNGDTIFWELTVTNLGEEEVTLTRLTCGARGALLRLYDSAGALRFDEYNRSACFPVGPMQNTIAPLEAHTFGRAQTTDAILGDSLPAGTYALTVGVEFEEDFTGRPEIPVGEFHLEWSGHLISDDGAPVLGAAGRSR
jgi:hypothetical protein